MFKLKGTVILGCALALLPNPAFSAADPVEHLERKALSSPRASSLNQLPRGEENSKDLGFSQEMEGSHPVLPLEILERIIQYSSPKTAKRWYLTCRDARELVLRRGHLKPKSEIKYSQLIALIGFYSTYLTSLNLDSCRQITPEIISRIKEIRPGIIISKY